MKIIAHRGASATAPENTLAAMRLAWLEEADAIECDVRLTADGRLAVIHDETTARVAGSGRVVAECTLAELQSLDVGRWKDPRYTGERIPALEDVLATVPPGKRAFVELKGGPQSVTELGRCLGQSPLLPEQVVIISFDFDAVITAKKSLPTYEAAWIVDHPHRNEPAALDEVLAQARDGGIDGLDFSARWKLDRATVERIHGARLKVYVWTVDDASLARRLAAAGIDGVATNRPGSLRRERQGG